MVTGPFDEVVYGPDDLDELLDEQESQNEIMYGQEDQEEPTKIELDVEAVIEGNGDEAIGVDQVEVIIHEQAIAKLEEEEGIEDLFRGHQDTEMRKLSLPVESGLQGEGAWDPEKASTL